MARGKKLTLGYIWPTTTTTKHLTALRNTHFKFICLQIVKSKNSLQLVGLYRQTSDVGVKTLMLWQPL